MQAVFTKIVSWIMAILAFLGLVKPETPVTESPGSYQIDGNTVVFCLDANPTTGYAWTAAIDGDCVELTRDEYTQHPSEPNMAGVGGDQYYGFTAVQPGTAVVTFHYARSWETTDADRTLTAAVTVGDDLTVTVTSFTEA